MPFGVLGGPMHFQYIVDTEIAKMGVTSVVGYMDDITAHGDNIARVWEDTLAVLKQFTGCGFMINLRKCKFL
jgi:hypothetical protein